MSENQPKKKSADYGPLRVIDTPEELILEIDWRYQRAPGQQSSLIPGGIALIVGLALIFLAPLMDVSALWIRLIGGTFALFGGLMLFAELAAQVNTTRIRITPQTIQSRTGPLPFSSVLGADTFSQPTEQIRQIVVERFITLQENRAPDETGAADYSADVYLARLLNRNGTERKLFMFYGAPGVASAIEQRIEDYLGIPDDPNARPARQSGSLVDAAERLAGRDDTDGL